MRPVVSCLALAALLLLGGCPNPADDGSGGSGNDVADTGSVAFADKDAPGATGDDGAPPADGEASGDDTSATEDTPAPPSDDGTPPLDDGTPPEDTGPPPPEAPNIFVDPAEYTFSYISPLPQLLTRQFTVANGGSSSLTITGVEMKAGSSADFGLIGVPPLPKTLLPGDHTLFIARFLEQEGGTGTVLVHSNDPDTPTLEVPLASHIKATVNSPDPCVKLTPSALNFGTVQRGDVKTLSATLENCSATVPLVLSDITRSSFLFIPLTQELQVTPMPPLPSTIPPGGKLTIDVAYAPLLAGPDVGYFLFHTDDPAEPAVQLDVVGIGVEPPPEEIALTIKLSWDEDLCDVDSHLIEPGGAFFDCKTDCHFGNPAPDWGVVGDWKDDPFLDVDDVDGFGPEHINISAPQPGTYRFIVHYYRDNFEDSWGVSTNAKVEVFNFNQKIAEFGPEYLDKTNRNWDVFDIEWPSMQVTALGQTYVVPQSAVKTCLPFFP